MLIYIKQHLLPDGWTNGRTDKAKTYLPANFVWQVIKIILDYHIYNTQQCMNYFNGFTVANAFILIRQIIQRVENSEILRIHDYVNLSRFAPNCKVIKQLKLVDKNCKVIKELKLVDKNRILPFSFSGTNSKLIWRKIIYIGVTY